LKIKASTKDAYQLVHDGILALARAEQQGIRIDTEYCEKKKQHITRRIDHLQKQIEGTKFYRRWNHIYGSKTNIYSNHQLSNILYKIMKVTPPKLTNKGNMGATDEDALSHIDIPELKLILQMRKLAKIRDTYLEAFLREEVGGYIHPFFHLHLARTYRSSSSSPNFQNIPKRDKEALKICRGALFPRPEHQLLEADFSAIEVNISCQYHKDPVMLSYLKDENSDMHLDMAKQIFIFDSLDKNTPSHSILRQAAKNGFVFPQFYGDYYENNAKGIAEWIKLPQTKWRLGTGIKLSEDKYISDHLIQHGIKSFTHFVEHMKDVENDFWTRRFKGYAAWRKAWVKKYRELGYLKMLSGFVCSGTLRKNEIINYPIQGTAFHCLLYTFIKLDEIMRKESWDSKLIGQIHDSILMDVNPNELVRIETTIQKIVKEELPKFFKWIVIPLEIEIEVYEGDKPWV